MTEFSVPALQALLDCVFKMAEQTKGGKSFDKKGELPAAAKPAGNFQPGGQHQLQKLVKRKSLENSEFRGILRILGKDVEGHYTIAEALRLVKGVGANLAANLVGPISAKLGVPPSELIGNLSEAQTGELELMVKFPQKHGVKKFLLNRQQDFDSGEDKHLLMADLTFAVRQDATRERDSRSYKGWRMSIGQKVRGQHSRTTGRTGMTMGVLKKAVKAQKGAAASSAQEKSAPAPKK